VFPRNPITFSVHNFLDVCIKDREVGAEADQIITDRIELAPRSACKEFDEVCPRDAKGASLTDKAAKEFTFGTGGEVTDDTAV